MRMRKAGSSSPRPSRAPGISRFGRSGLDSPSFHTGKVTVLKADADKPHRCKRCNRSPLIGSRCASCGYDNRACQLARNHRRHHPRQLDNILGDDLDNADAGLLGDLEDDDATDEGEQ